MRNSEGVDSAANVSIPLGPLYMAAYLRKMNYQANIEIYDARLSAKFVKYGSDTRYFGDSWDDVSQTILAFKPDVVAISNMFSWQISAALETARISKNICPQAVTVLGGPHASSFPEQMIENQFIDFVVMGEGEERFYYLLESLSQNNQVAIQGVLGTVNDSELLRPNKKAPIKFINDLDELPFPAYDMVDTERYFYLQSHGYAPRVRERGNRAVTILTSRGCPHQCVFCSIQTTMGYKFRYHSPDYVHDHISHLKTNFGIDFIHFEDDNFTHELDRYDAIIDMLLSLNPVIHWDTPNGVRADSWTRERLQRTKASGCQHLCIAIESSVQRVIDHVVKKKLDLSTVEPVMRISQEIDLPLSAFYVLGLPGETADEIKSNVQYAISKYQLHNVYPTFSIAKPLPGTELYETVVEQNLFHGTTQDAPPRQNTIKTDEFDPDFINTIYNYANRKKTQITIKNMLSNPSSFSYFVRLAFKNPWFLKNILQSALHSFVDQFHRTRRTISS